MKGTFFQKPLEFSLRVEGEAWNQGDPIRGELVAKNHGGEPLPLGEIRVHLARGGLKKVRQKSDDAFEILASAALEGGTLGAGQSSSLPWTFKTDRNFPITDAFGSLFLLYGRGESPAQLGQLQLTFHPDPIIQQFVERLKIGFRFVEKGRKSAKGRVEIKFAPPSAKAFAALEQLVLQLGFEGEELQVKYLFQIKKVEATAAAVGMKKEKREVEQAFAPTRYLLPSGRVDHEHLEAAIREALQTVESKMAL